MGVLSSSYHQEDTDRVASQKEAGPGSWAPRACCSPTDLGSPWSCGLRAPAHLLRYLPGTAWLQLHQAGDRGSLNDDWGCSTES